MNEKEILEIKKKVIEMKNTLTGLSIQERISEPEGGLVKILTLKSKAGGGTKGYMAQKKRFGQKRSRTSDAFGQAPHEQWLSRVKGIVRRKESEGPVGCKSEC